ncbi:hypothetical protein B7463_g10594, partial [Scytalidium lignicola]
MSTFKGILQEFPDIRIDYFRHHTNHRPPLACFLSHVHSDHLAGLESLKSPFIYCSAATKALLLRLERYPHRVNFERGILESRRQHYKHLKNLLKPIPLQTPTRIELGPGNEIQITLFDANHCTGAVMFLIEGNGKAVLYTGDVRSEPWFVNSLMRNPFLIPYAAGIKRIDCMYLDTSNIRPISFQTKAEGLKELLEKVAKYPDNTVFHLTAWTFGYEEVWMALSKALQSPVRGPETVCLQQMLTVPQIHVDKYKLKLYQSLGGGINGGDHSSLASKTHDAPALIGYMCGNTFQAGCLTNDCNVRIHSCEKRTNCPALKENTVWIRPIVTRNHRGEEMKEVGVGGGLGDLTESSELEVIDTDTITKLLHLFENAGKSLVGNVRKLLLNGLQSPTKTVSLSSLGLDSEGQISLADFTKTLTRPLNKKVDPAVNSRRSRGLETSAYNGLPKFITFPYSRHSSYEELCHLVREFNPRDIFPCTVDEANWNEGLSMESIFGHECSATSFRHDIEMRELHCHRYHSNLETLELPTEAVSRLTSSTSSFELHTDLPSSEFQKQRRRAILNDLDEIPAKRIRFNSDGPNSSPPPERLHGQSADLNGSTRQRKLNNTLLHPRQAPASGSTYSFSAHIHSESDVEARPSSCWDNCDELWRCYICGDELLTRFWPCEFCEPERFLLCWEEIDGDTGNCY